MKKLFVITGPTGTGKSKMAIQLAKAFNGEIINADSRQLYKELKIGVARPTEADFEGIPHHLFGIISLGDASFDAVHFKRMADLVIADLQQRKKIPIVVGGTGLYIKSLLFGLFEGPKKDEVLRAGLTKRMEQEGLDALYRDLSQKDPEAAQGIKASDTHRILRGLEVYEITGKPISEHQKAHGFCMPHYSYLKIGLDVEKEVLKKQLDWRVDQMIQLGLEKEVRDLHASFPNHPLLCRTIGYQEWFPYFQELKTKEEVILEIKLHTRQLAKRQRTWFRKEKDIHWFHPEKKDQIHQLLGSFIG